MDQVVGRNALALIAPFQPNVTLPVLATACRRDTFPNPRLVPALALALIATYGNLARRMPGAAATALAGRFPLCPGPGAEPRLLHCRSRGAPV
jgi:hypothetical protein